MTEKTTKTITLEINGEDLRFEAGAKDYQKFLDEASPGKKVVPMQRLLQRTIVPEDKEKLDKYLDLYFAELAGCLVQELSGDVEVTVKK